MNNEEGGIKRSARAPSKKGGAEDGLAWTLEKLQEDVEERIQKARTRAD
ncbi:MAG TPA: hypothetical protein VM534_04730 [Thermoanaerobaculia bacterium]|nr:hypothetical protein [Thermoanaerobaculia bacterium]